jgi:membrane-associated phospholipid phosphatase
LPWILCKDCASPFIIDARAVDGCVVEHRTVQRVPVVRPRCLIGAVAACGVLSILVWHARGPVGWERPFIALLRHEQLPMARPLVAIFEPIPFAIAVLALAWTAAKSRRIQLAFAGTAGCALAMFVTEWILKPLVDRHHQHWGSAVFPSGHVTAAAAWATFASLVFDPPPQLRLAFAAVPVLVGWAVVASGAHYPTDAIAGLLVGGAVVYCAVAGAARASATTPGNLIDLESEHNKATTLVADRRW